PDGPGSAATAAAATLAAVAEWSRVFLFSRASVAASCTTASSASWPAGVLTSCATAALGAASPTASRRTRAASSAKGDRPRIYASNGSARCELLRPGRERNHHLRRENEPRPPPVAARSFDATARAGGARDGGRRKWAAAAAKGAAATMSAPPAPDRGTTPPKPGLTSRSVNAPRLVKLLAALRWANGLAADGPPAHHALRSRVGVRRRRARRHRQHPELERGARLRRRARSARPDPVRAALRRRQL